MNKLAAIQHAVEEVNKEGMFGLAHLGRAGVAAKNFGARIFRRATIPPVGAPGAAQAASSAQNASRWSRFKQGVKDVGTSKTMFATSIGMPMAFGKPAATTLTQV